MYDGRAMGKAGTMLVTRPPASLTVASQQTDESVGRMRARSPASASVSQRGSESRGPSKRMTVSAP